MYTPKQYSIYQKVHFKGGRTEWIGTHRLPISSALKMARELRDRGERIVWRLNGEYGPTQKD